PATAQVLNASFQDYPVLRAASLPWFDTILAEDPTPGNPLRIKGGGESGITPSLPVVVNAALDALRPLGVKELETPLTPARVWEAIERARQRAGVSLSGAQVERQRQAARDADQHGAHGDNGALGRA